MLPTQGKYARAQVEMDYAADVRGGAPGTRETDVLSSENLVGRADAIVLTGGSVFGLAAADAEGPPGEGRGGAARPAQAPERARVPIAAPDAGREHRAGQGDLIAVAQQPGAADGGAVDVGEVPPQVQQHRALGAQLDAGVAAGRGCGATEAPRGLLYHRYDLDAEGTTDLEWCETLGDPEVSVRIIFDGEELEPVQSDGSIEIIADEPFLRGDIDGNGTVSALTDALHLL